MLMLDWAWKLKADGVRVWAISPGFLAADLGGAREMLRKAGAGEPRLGGEFIARVVQGERDGDAGKVIRNDGVVQDW